MEQEINLDILGVDAEGQEASQVVEIGYHYTAPDPHPIELETSTES